MPTKKFLQRFVLTMMPSAILWLHAQSSHNVPGIALDQLELNNVKAEAANYSGKPAVRVDALPDAANGASYAILKGSRLHNGTIEVELAGKPGANAGPGARGFIGIAFRVQGNRFEYIRNWRFGCAITTDLQNKCLNEVFDPATQRTLANFQPAPELRHRGGKFKRNITARRLRRNGYNDALLRLIVSLVRYHYSLAGLDTTRHQDQSASSIDGDCKGLLVKRIAT